MSHDTIALHTLSFPENAELYTHWRHPGRNMQIYMPTAAVQMLAQQSLRRSQAHPPSELGGVLLGKVQQGPEGSLQLILAPEIVSSSSCLFNTSDHDLRSLARSLLQPRQSGWKVMGYFRSHLREGLCLSSQDEVLIRDCFSNPDSVFLIIRPFEIGICMAGFFFWDGDRLQTDVSELEVPFAAGAGAEPASPSSEDIHCARPSEPKPNPRTATPPPTLRAPIHIPQERRATADAGPQRSRSLRWGALLGFCCFLVACLASYLLVAGDRAYFSLPARSTSDTALGLQVNAGSGGQWDLRWNQSLADIKKAQNAKLSIVDGPIHRELMIDQEQLRFGRLSYFPNSEDVQFSLEVYLSAARSISESVRVLSPHPQRNEPAREASSTGVAALQPGITPARHLNTRSSAAAPAEPARSASLSISTFGARSSGSRFNLNGSLMAARPRMFTTALPPPLELLAGMPNVPVSNPGFVVSQLPPAPEIAPPVQAAPHNTYIPPRPLREIMPNKSLLASSTLYRTVDVPVHVEIDEKGRVSEARLLHQESSKDALLSAQAIAAAKQWVFSPATLHGTAIPSSHVLVFRFQPTE